jgi:hypothetical protein
MNLLLRLDSVRVFHCCYALRDLRKFLIKRAIVLQEFVDQIQMITTEVEDENGEGKCDGVEDICLEKEEVGCEEENEGGKKIEALVNEVNCMEKEYGGCDVEIEGGENMDSVVNEEKDVDGGEGKYKEEENFLMEENEEEGEDEGEEKMEVVEEKEESVGTSLVEEGIEVESVDVKEEKVEEENCYKEEDDGNRKMLKRMMEDNEKMMEMMTQLFERNEKQTSLLTSLTQRVDQLERSFTCDKLRKKNKRRNVDAKHRYYNGYI